MRDCFIEEDGVLVPEQMGALTLAYIGDCVWEMHVRLRILDQGIEKINNLHKSAIKSVCCAAQSKAVHMIMDSLTEQEQSVFRRGRNAKSTPPKNADVVDYKNATGFEALLGYLYLKGNDERLKTVLKLAFDALKEERE